MLNEWGEIVLQVLTITKSSVEFDAQLTNFKQRIARLAPESGVELVYVDDCCSSRKSLAKAFPSLKKDTAKAPSVRVGLTPLVLVDFPAVTEIERVETTEAANLAADGIIADVDASDPHMPFIVGLDAEWKLGSSSVDVVQVATSNRCIVFQVARMKHKPIRLQHLLEHRGVLVVGRSVSSDLRRIARYFLFESTPEVYTARVASLCLGQLAKAVGVSKDARTGTLAKFVELTMEKELPKDPSVRQSDWSGSLTEDQLLYAGLDALASREVYFRLLLMAGRVDFEASTEGLRLVMLSDGGQRVVARGQLVARRGPIHKGKVVVEVSDRSSDTLLRSAAAFGRAKDPR